MITFSFLGKYVQTDQVKFALISKNQNLTYAELNSRIINICSILTGRGIRKYSKVIFPGTNDIDFILLLLSIWQLGAIPIPINTKLKDKEKSTLINIALPDFIFENNKFPYEISHPDNKVFEQTSLDGDDPGIVIFTSGSSGIPKGVVLSINNLINSADITNELLKPEIGDKWLASLPFFHIGGIMIIVRSFSAGLSIVLPESFDPGEIAFCCKEFRPQFISLVPTIFKRLLDNNAYPNSDMKYVLLGGGHVQNELASEGISKGWKILKVYGSSETCSMFTALNMNEGLNKLSSTGTPLKDNSVIIVNEKQEELPTGESGEIAVSGSTVFKEYLNNKEETFKKLHNNFYFTGDIGYLDHDGYLYIESRRTDLIISGGENISPVEIENALLKIPFIEQACVIGIADNEWGQIPAAVLRSSGSKDPKEIVEFLRNEIASYKIPKRIYFLDEFPTTALGKINKEQLRTLFL